MFNKDVLPQPELPIIATNSPYFTSKDTFFNIGLKVLFSLLNGLCRILWLIVASVFYLAVVGTEYDML